MLKRIIPALAALLVACVGNTECRLDDPRSCSSGLVCEQVSGEDVPQCFAPVQVEGKVFDLLSGQPVAGAEVTALTINGTAVTGVAVSGVDGHYTLPIPTERSDSEGTPVGTRVTLRAAARNYRPFPSGVRISLPLDTTGATSAGNEQPWVLASAQTDVGLSAGLSAERFWLNVSGTVEVPAGKPALVVIEGNGRVYSAVTDASGTFRVFNVTPGSGYTVQAYVKGANYTQVDLQVPSSGMDVSSVSLRRAGDASAVLNGNVQWVAGANSAGTSVVMMVESTFHDLLVRGEVPPGLRAPDPDLAPTVTGAFSISGVPDGKYVVLAAFENDGNVRDPDPNISDMQLVHLTVANGIPSLSPSFKVTGAIEIVSPGAGEATDQVTFPPKFRWKPYPSASSYEVRLFDSQGSEVWENLAVAADAQNGSGVVQAAYTGKALIRGLTYQWRATAKDTAGTPISSTEDLRGLFIVQ